MTSYPIWEGWITLFVISNSHEPHTLHVSCCLSVSCRALLLSTPLKSHLYSLPDQIHTSWHRVWPHDMSSADIFCCCYRQQVLITKDVTHCALWYHTMVCDHDEHRNSQCALHLTGCERKRSAAVMSNLQPFFTSSCCELIVCLYVSLNGMQYSERCGEKFL